jgi:hypothetical protein
VELRPLLQLVLGLEELGDGTEVVLSRT